MSSLVASECSGIERHPDNSFHLRLRIGTVLYMYMAPAYKLYACVSPVSHLCHACVTLAFLSTLPCLNLSADGAHLEALIIQWSSTAGLAALRYLRSWRRDMLGKAKTNGTAGGGACTEAGCCDMLVKAKTGCVDRALLRSKASCRSCSLMT